MTTSALSLREVLTALLKGDDDLKTALGVGAGKLHAVFRGMAPSGVARPYIVVGSSNEDPLKLFGGAGNSGTETLHIWSDKAGDLEVLTVYGHVDRLLNGTRLTVPGFAPVRGETRVIFILPVVENGKTTTHGLIEYASSRYPA